MTERAIIVVDLQNEYWPSGKLPLVGIEAAAANAAKVIANARERGDLVVNVRHETPSPDAPIFTPGTDGVRINPAVAPADGEPVVTKAFPNSFRETDVKAILDENGVKSVVVIGAMSHMCIDATTRAAYDLGYGVTTIHDACATCDQEFNGVSVPAAQVHATIMSALAFVYAEVVDTETWLSR